MELPSNMSSSQKGEIMDQVKQQIAVSIIQKHKSSDEIYKVSVAIYSCETKQLFKSQDDHCMNYILDLTTSLNGSQYFKMVSISIFFQ